MPEYSDFGGTFSWWSQSSTVHNLQQLTTNVWQHLALVRSGANFKWFVNGVNLINFSSSVSYVGSDLWIGSNAVWGHFLAFAQFYLNSFRLTKIVRYTVNFNPETDTYLN